MKALYKLFLLPVIGATALSAAASVLNLSDSSTQPSLIMPESFETDTHKMLENWYLKNYAVLDYEADKRADGEFSDEILIERLSKIPAIIEMPLNTPVKNAILFYANRKKQLVENMLGLSLYYMPIFEEALERHGMPNELKYLPVIESALVPEAVSKAGAAGLWQFMSATGSGLGLEINSLIDQRRDPILASDAGARYLKQLYNTYNDWSLAIAAYNCGPGNVNKALRRAGDGKHDFWDIYPFLPAETRNYVPAFIAANYIMTYYKEHNISPALARRPIVTDTVHVSRRVHFDQISQVMDIPVSELRALNPQFRQDIIPGDIRPYALVLPSLQAYAYIANEDSIVNHNAAKYARRGVVEPASGAVTGRDSRGEYYDEETIQYHTVKKGETLAKIAQRYGVSVSSIQKLNKVGKTVKAGRKLKIKTVTRRYKPAPAPEPEKAEEQSNVAAADTTAVPETPVEQPDSIGRNAEVAAAFAPEETKEEAAPAPAPTEEKAQPTPPAVKSNNDRTPAKPKPQANRTHTVQKGENLSKIAKKYGVTVQAIKKANNLKNDNIAAGQKLKIPAK